jgi:glutaminase
MDYQAILNEIHAEVNIMPNSGKVASYIPELAKINPNQFGMHLLSMDDTEFSVGDSNVKFSIQSISKVLSLTLAFSLIGEKIWERVGVEPSGTAFNSLVQLETDKGKPRNPLINPGAIVVADILVSQLVNPKRDFLNFVKSLAETENIDFNYEVAESERKTGFRNAALANLLKSFGNIKNNVDTVLDFYFHQCAIEMTCKDLAHSFSFLANEGKTLHDEKQILNPSHTKRMNAIMQTCGFYDEAGEFSYKVGLPGKSGVGGGIVAVFPKKYVVSTWSPPLNEKGNSVYGLKSLELLTTKTGMSIF